jgi:hypothetical protein
MQSPLIGNHSLSGLEMDAPPPRAAVPTQDKLDDEMARYLRWRAVSQLAAVGVFILVLVGLALFPGSVSEPPSTSVTPSMQVAVTPNEPAPEPPSSFP